MILNSEFGIRNSEFCIIPEYYVIPECNTIPENNALCGRAI